jgi:hypothetical protein
MYRIVMSILFIVVLAGGYFVANGGFNESPVKESQVPQQSPPPSGSTFNGL